MVDRSCRTCKHAVEIYTGYLNDVPAYCWDCAGSKHDHLPYWECMRKPCTTSSLPKCTCNQPDCKYPHTGEDDYG